MDKIQNCDKQQKKNKYFFKILFPVNRWLQRRNGKFEEAHERIEILPLIMGKAIIIPRMFRTIVHFFLIYYVNVQKSSQPDQKGNTLFPLKVSPP